MDKENSAAGREIHNSPWTSYIRCGMSVVRETRSGSASVTAGRSVTEYNYQRTSVSGTTTTSTSERTMSARTTTERTTLLKRAPSNGYGAVSDKPFAEGKPFAEDKPFAEGKPLSR